MKKGVWLFVFTAVFLLASVASASAFGVAQDYVKNQTLRLMQDGTFELNLYLQNPTDEVVPVQLEVTGDVVQVKDAQEVYNLSPKTYENTVTLLITAPKKAQPGDVHLIRYSITPFQEQEGGQLGMRTKISRTLTVVIVDEHGVGKPPLTTLQKFVRSKLTQIVFALVVFLALVAFVVMLLIRKSVSLSKILLRFKKKKPQLPDGLTPKQMHRLTERLKRCKTDEEYEKVLQNAWKKKK